MTDTSQRIGFIGTGIMGGPMAGHLLAAGHHLFIHNRTRSKAAQLEASGAQWCLTPADVGRRCDILCLNVTDTPDVNAVLFGKEGAAATLASGALVIDFSTISPQRTRVFADRLADQDVAMLDAPVTGGDVGARQATLTIMVGGPTEAFDRARPLLDLLGRNVVHVGPSGSGQALKACNQILCAVNMIGVCEALTLARRSGLDLPTALQTLSGGAGGSWAWANLGPKIATDDLDPAFMVRLIQKDLRIVQDTALAERIPLPGTALAQQLFRAVEAAQGGADLGTQAMILAYRRLIGEDDRG